MRPRKGYTLFLIVIVLIGRGPEVSSKPIPQPHSSDILSGVDFLSMFMHSATQLPKQTSLTNNLEVTTIYNEEITQNDERGEKKGGEEEIDKVAFVKENPSAIVANSNRNEFNIDETDPILINRQDNLRVDSKVKRKSEDLLAIGANPDYIAQQQSRLHNNNYNHPYLNRQSSRSRSVSYSAVIQSLPSNIPPEKSWKDSNPVIAKPNHNLDDYDYTEPPNISPNPHSTAESKYNPGEFNESADKKHEPHERNWGFPEKNYGNLPQVYGKPEQNYEIDEAVSVMTNGRAHGVQSNPTEKPQQDDNQKVGYVVEGRNYRKYRVEERTSDGFIVGEYGVVSNNDGSLRGVRYTADGTINPRVIYDALMKFLAL